MPQDLRAANLAAFEMVDYVVVDKNAKPLENIAYLQPDYFAKGYEYRADSINPKTAEEAAVLAEYGGEMIFTPGDVVYSSSRLIELEPPAIKYEKLIALMERSGVTFDSMRWTVEGMVGRRAHVVGDTIVDSLTRCAMIGGQTKTPTMSVLYEERQDFIGGAGVVSKHLRAAGAEVVFSTVLGDDPLKDFVLEGLEETGVEVRAAIDKTRPTTNKNAFVVGGYRLLKVDTLDNRSITGRVLNKMVKSVRDVEADTVVFSDFRHGVFNRRTIPTLTAAIPEGPFRVADSQVASRWGNITEFTGFDLITPNEREARFALADQDSGVRQLSSDIYDAALCGTLILKLGDRGVLTCQSPDHEALDSFFSVDSFTGSVVDAVGAGDALLAYATLSMLVSRSAGGGDHPRLHGRGDRMRARRQRAGDDGRLADAPRRRGARSALRLTAARAHSRRCWILASAVRRGRRRAAFYRRRRGSGPAGTQPAFPGSGGDGAEAGGDHGEKAAAAENRLQRINRGERDKDDHADQQPFDRVFDQNRPAAARDVRAGHGRRLESLARDQLPRGEMGAADKQYVEKNDGQSHCVGPCASPGCRVLRRFRDAARAFHD